MPKDSWAGMIPAVGDPCYWPQPKRHPVWSVLWHLGSQRVGEKTVVTQMATPLEFHDLFSHQDSGSEITGCPLLLNELRVVWDIGYLEKGATAVIGGSEVTCLSKAKIFSSKDWCPSEFSTQNRIKGWLTISLPDRPLYFEHASVFPKPSRDTDRHRPPAWSWDMSRVVEQSLL